MKTESKQSEFKKLQEFLYNNIFVSEIHIEDDNLYEVYNFSDMLGIDINVYFLDKNLYHLFNENIAKNEEQYILNKQQEKEKIIAEISRLKKERQQTYQKKYKQRQKVKQEVNNIFNNDIGNIINSFLFKQRKQSK